MEFTLSLISSCFYFFTMLYFLYRVCAVYRKEITYMAALNKNTHLTLEERKIIQRGIENRSSKKSIADTLGKDKSTIGKEIKNHRILSCKSKYPLECVFAYNCKNKYTSHCSTSCLRYKKFSCKFRDRSPGVCNGCENYRKCKFNKYKYDAQQSQDEYKELLTDSRSGVNATVNEIKELGLLIKPLIDKGQSLYVICRNHPEINVTERTLYSYIEDGVFQNAGVSIKNIDLKRKVRRKMTKKKNVEYAKRTDRSYLKGRTYDCFEEYMSANPNTHVVEMDTVYNDVSNGPFIQTFKFLKYDLLFCIYHEHKEALDMVNGILLLEQLLSEEIFSKECEVILTDRGSEFITSYQVETRENGTSRTRIFYCDAMQSCQKGSVENVHSMLREICPKESNLYSLGLTSQAKANLISSNINSYVKEKLDGKTSFQLVEFFNPDMADKLYSFGLSVIQADDIVLKPYLLKMK